LQDWKLFAHLGSTNMLMLRQKVSERTRIVELHFRKSDSVSWRT